MIGYGFAFEEESWYRFNISYPHPFRYREKM